ncbi:MAG: M28 family metallopeptidase [Candidatus Hermodarchaeota archaeon]
MIDENRIIENLKDLSFPRLSGTEGEKKVYNIVKKKIESIGVFPNTQEFSFSIFFSRIYPKLTLALISWLLFILFLNVNSIFNLVNLIIVFICILTFITITRNPEKIKLGSKYHSQNLFLKLSSKNATESSDYNILLFSHLDSKGQTFSIKNRIRIYYAWAYTFPLSLLIIVIYFFLLPNAYLILRILGFLIIGLNMTAAILLWMNRTNNISRGAIDNASGVTCLLELISYFSDHKHMPKNFDLWFVFTGAEESGTMGVRNFYKYIKNFDRDKTFTSNFDSFAHRIYLWDHGLLNNKYSNTTNFILENKNIISIEKTKRFYIGVYSDGLFLYNKHFQGLGSGDISTNSYIHSIDDTLDKINIQILKKLCEFYTILLKDFDNNINKIKSADL